MTRDYFINSIKNFINTQINRYQLTNDVSTIIDDLSKYLGENLINSSRSSNNNSSFQIPQEFTGEFSDLSDYNLSLNSQNTISSDKSYKNNQRIQRSIINWRDFLNITCHPGFDGNDLQNGRQNNCACSIEDFDGYIYVGTGRNIPYSLIKNTISRASVPLDYAPLFPNMGAEIWRYNKNGYSQWQRVFKSQCNNDENTSNIIEISSIVSFRSLNLKPSLYAVGSSASGIKILKSTNGVDWFCISSNLSSGRSSGKMIVYRHKIYLSVNSDDERSRSLLYSSEDPEIFGWTLETACTSENSNNPIGEITSMASFNNHLYLGTYSENGFMIWRTNNEEPKKDDWKLVIDKGAGDASNTTAVSLAEFKNRLYVGTGNFRRDLLNFIFPKGAEIIRIDKKDNWKIVIGGDVVEKSEPKTGTRNLPLSRISNGFFNPYNIFISQMKVYNNKLYIGTYDNSTNVAPIYEFLLKNRDLLNNIFDDNTVEILTLFMELQLKIFSLIKNHFGFDLYISNNGLDFKLIDSFGFDDSDNTGISTIFINSSNNMYIGTFNPFLGTNIYRMSPHHFISRSKSHSHSTPNKSQKNFCIICT
ncbi:MAG: hypothetical protein ACI398_09145 [Clostridium sp.]